MDRAADELCPDYGTDRVGLNAATADSRLLRQANGRARFGRDNGGLPGHVAGLGAGLSGHATGDADCLWVGERRFPQQLRYGQSRALGSRAVSARKSLMVFIQGG